MRKFRIVPQGLKEWAVEREYMDTEFVSGGWWPFTSYGYLKDVPAWAYLSGGFKSVAAAKKYIDQLHQNDIEAEHAKTRAAYTAPIYYP